MHDLIRAIKPDQMHRIHELSVIAVVCAVAFGVAGWGVGQQAGENAVRGEAAQATRVSNTLVNMHFRDLQVAQGIPLEHQINCEPVERISKGTYHVTR